MVDIKLDDVNLKDIVSAAILQSLTEEKRAVLIKEAIQYLMTPQRNTYSGTQQTPLQEAFQTAIFQVARQVVIEQVNKDPDIQAVIAEMIRKAWVIAKDNDNYVQNLASNIANILAPSSR